MVCNLSGLLHAFSHNLPFSLNPKAPHVEFSGSGVDGRSFLLGRDFLTTSQMQLEECSRMFRSGLAVDDNLMINNILALNE